MKKIFQTGLAFGNENGTCEACNLNYSWLLNTPSNLLWIDKVVVTKPIWDIITKENNDKGKSPSKDQVLVIGKAIKLVYEILHSVDLIEIVDSNEISEEDSQIIYNQIEEDLNILKNNGEVNTEDNHIYCIGSYRYCIPSLWTLYASLVYSRRNNCNFSLEEDQLVYLRKLLALKESQEFAVSRKSYAINEVLRMYLPEINIWPEYMFEDRKRCLSCGNFTKCDDSYLSSVEKNLFNLLEEREHDEIKEFCQVLDDICDEKFKDSYEVEPEGLLRELQVKKVKVQGKINKVYKKVDNWSKIVTTISSALSLGCFFGHPKLTAIGGVGMFASNAAEKISDYYQNKYKWVNFINSHADNMEK